MLIGEFYNDLDELVAFMDLESYPLNLNLTIDIHFFIQEIDIKNFYYIKNNFVIIYICISIF